MKTSYTELVISTRNLGIILDCILETEKPLNGVCKSCSYQIRYMTNIRPYIPTEACRTSAQICVVSGLTAGADDIENTPKPGNRSYLLYDVNISNVAVIGNRPWALSKHETQRR